MLAATYREEGMAEPQLKPREVKIRVHDGVDIAVALYMPEGDGRFPVVLGASPYRYDNNALPAWSASGRTMRPIRRGACSPSPRRR
jgi:predicted acyl esterase